MEKEKYEIVEDDKYLFEKIFFGSIAAIIVIPSVLMMCVGECINLFITHRYGYGVCAILATLLLILCIASVYLWSDYRGHPDYAKNLSDWAKLKKRYVAIERVISFMYCKLFPKLARRRFSKRMEARFKGVL